ncbi:hypothetical protein BDR03DRAFT_986627 [Suillus americanus]|nr:hypothetical protein BDR03DRAFT_986627 [Suillus americanus]
MANADIYDLMEMMENLLKGMAKYLNSSSMIVKYYPKGKDSKELVLYFKTLWKRYDMIKMLEKKTEAQHQHLISRLLEWWRRGEADILRCHGEYSGFASGRNMIT